MCRVHAAACRLAGCGVGPPRGLPTGALNLWTVVDNVENHERTGAGLDYAGGQLRQHATVAQSNLAHGGYQRSGSATPISVIVAWCN